MSSAKASGADAGNARNREHNQGNQERKATPEQAAAVLRIRRCAATAFYEILSVEKACTDAEVKKAYRKQSLLTHPDKNGHEKADEAFKMVSRAFGVLGDKEKREKFDRFGTDPDSRFESARAQAQNPFSGGGFGGGRPAGAGSGGGNMWEDEISPEEMFQRFFSGGFGGGGGPFGGGGGGFGGECLFSCPRLDFPSARATGQSRFGNYVLTSFRFRSSVRVQSRRSKGLPGPSDGRRGAATEATHTSQRPTATGDGGLGHIGLPAPNIIPLPFPTFDLDIFGWRQPACHA